MPIPVHEASGLLPKGVHDTDWSEVKERFGKGYKRSQLIRDLEFVLRLLEGQSVNEVWIDGSFVTTKARPNDVDMAYFPPAIALTGLVSRTNQARLKTSHHIDLWPFPSVQPGMQSIVSFFSSDRDGRDKGLVRLRGKFFP